MSDDIQFLCTFPSKYPVNPNYKHLTVELDVFLWSNHLSHTFSQLVYCPGYSFHTYLTLNSIILKLARFRYQNLRPLKITALAEHCRLRNKLDCSSYCSVVKFPLCEV